MLQQIFVALVGFLRRCEAGKLAHSEKLAAVSGSVNAARVRRLAGIAQILVVVPVFGKIGGGVKPANGNPGDCSKASVAVVIEVYTGSRTDRLFRSFIQCRSKGLLRPALFCFRGMSVGEHVSDRSVGGLRLREFALAHSVSL